MYTKGLNWMVCLLLMTFVGNLLVSHMLVCVCILYIAILLCHKECWSFWHICVCVCVCVSTLMFWRSLLFPLFLSRRFCCLQLVALRDVIIYNMYIYIYMCVCVVFVCLVPIWVYSLPWYELYIFVFSVEVGVCMQTLLLSIENL